MIHHMTRVSLTLRLIQCFDHETDPVRRIRLGILIMRLQRRYT